jgi:subtilase family serine protease
MKFSHVCRALIVCAAAAAVGGCGGSQVAPPASIGQGSAAAKYAATPACGAPRAGEAQCLVLIEHGAVAPNVAGWAPKDFQAHYKLPSRSKGSGQIVAIVDAFDNPNVTSDLSKYRSEFGLGRANFTKYNQKGESKNYPKGSMDWGLEIDLDAQMVSASCPLCTIYLIEANSAGSSDLEAAEAEAVALGAHIVSNSWICYGSISCVDEKYFDAKGVEYLAANGDNGYNDLGAPSVLESVAAIGGTLLSKTGSKYRESVWSGSGGGCATGIAKPPWQHDKVCTGRAVGDASAVAWHTAEYDSYGWSGWITVGGTSVATPLLAGVFGLAENATKQDGGRTFWEKTHHQDLYDVCGTSCLFSTYSYGGGWGSPDGVGAF